MRPRSRVPSQKRGHGRRHRLGVARMDEHVLTAHGAKNQVGKPVIDQALTARPCAAVAFAGAER